MSATLSPRSEFLDRVAETVRRRTGLVFTSGRRSDLERGLRKAMERAQLTDPEAYLGRLVTEPEPLDDLVAEITVGETYFFREPEQFALLKDRILPRLLASRSPDRPLRIWSAGCATGEEPYTIAIVLDQLGASRMARILGTDISRSALARARKACYTSWSLRGVPERVVQTHFARRGREFGLAAALRGAVEFGYLNLAEDTYPSLATGIWGMDLILCRNVLIYFDAATAVRVARQLLATLTQDGWLVLGASDLPLADVVPCDVVLTDGGLLYRRRQEKTEAPNPSLDWRQSPSKPFGLGAELAPQAPHPERRAVAPVLPAAPGPQPEPQEAVQAYLTGDYERASFLASRLTAQADAPADAWVLLVRANANRGELRDAGRACMAGLERHATCAELLYLHGLLLAQGGHLSQAASALRGALYLNRALAVAHLSLGQLLARLGQRDDARRSLQNAHQVLSRMPATEPVPAGDGECAGRLAEMARVHLQLLSHHARP